MTKLEWTKCPVRDGSEILSMSVSQFVSSDAGMYAVSRVGMKPGWWEAWGHFGTYIGRYRTKKAAKAACQEYVDRLLCTHVNAEEIGTTFSCTYGCKIMRCPVCTSAFNSHRKVYGCTHRDAR